MLEKFLSPEKWTNPADPSRGRNPREPTMTDESKTKITAELRVKSCVVGVFPKPSKKSPPYSNEKTEEVWEIKADGVISDTLYPVSVHLSTKPGHPVIPNFGKLKITIEAL